jgi:sugar/nucleoside kinase (ribokinase family)
MPVMKNVLGIGNALVDVMKMLPDDGIVNELGFSKGSMTLVDEETSGKIKDSTRDIETTLASGGSAANTMHGLAMMGMDAGFIGSVGKDEAGDFFEADMRNAGVNTYLLRRKTATGTAVAMVSRDSERTFGTHLGAAVELSGRDIKENLLTGYDILYLEGYLITNRDLVVTACKNARKQGIKVAIDMASFNVVEEFKEDFRYLISNYVDIVLANEDEARAFTGKEPFEALGDLSSLCEIVVVKIGSEGSYIKRGEEVIKVETINVKSLDTTGAGDLYAAGFLYGLCLDEDLDKCGAYGSILAGNVIEVVGPKMDKERWSRIFKQVETVKKEKS